MRRAVALGLLMVLAVPGGPAQGQEPPHGHDDAAPAEEATVLATTEADTAGSFEASEDPSGGALRVSMEFQNADIREVLKIFSRETGVNVIAGGDMREVPSVTLFLEDVSVTDALDQILRASNLAYERPLGSDIYIVKPISQTSPARITRVYQLKYARVSKSVLAQAAASLIKDTPFQAVIGTGEESSQAGGGGQTSIGVDEVIRALLTEEPGASVVVDGRTNRLIVTDVPENFPRLEAALAALDVRTAQILVDAELIETGVTKLKELGFEWGQEVLKVTPGFRTSRFPFNLFGDQNISAISPASGSRFSATTLDARTFEGILNALETDGDTKILARPKVLTLDNESALIRLTTEEAIGFKTTTGQATETTNVEPERTTTGVVLVVTPQVNEDGFITMLVEPSVAKTVPANITPPAGQGEIQDPKVRSSRTLVRIRSGDTLVVGGLIDRSDEKTLKRVPVLSGIPFLGEAFKNTSVDNSASELIVFITPTILNEPEAPQMAAGAGSALGLREQEPLGAQQETIEQTLNALEQQQRL